MYTLTPDGKRAAVPRKTAATDIMDHYGWLCDRYGEITCKLGTAQVPDIDSGHYVFLKKMRKLEVRGESYEQILERIYQYHLTRPGVTANPVWSSRYKPAPKFKVTSKPILNPVPKLIQIQGELF